jgi:Fe-S-cluster containining protein
VWFTPNEADAMARALGVSTAAFLERYTRRIGARRSLRELVRDGKHDCVFLDRDSRPGKAVCQLYAARPQQCRTWPWWPEVVESPATWEDTKRRTPCPGMGTGPVRSFVEITIGLTGGG